MAEIMVDYQPSLQHEIRMQVYKHPIETIRFLKNQDMRFYKYVLPLLSEKKYLMQSFLYQEGEIPKHVIMILKGKVLNMTTCKLMSEGNLGMFYLLICFSRRSGHYQKQKKAGNTHCSCRLNLHINR